MKLIYLVLVLGLILFSGCVNQSIKDPSELIEAFMDKYKVCNVYELKEMVTKELWEFQYKGKEEEWKSNCETVIKNKVTSFEIISSQEVGNDVFGRPIALVISKTCLKMDGQPLCESNTFGLVKIDEEWKITSLS